jgi:hypothetical protein
LARASQRNGGAGNRKGGMMMSIEDEADRGYGSRVLAAFKSRGLSTSQWNYATIQAMQEASRLEFLSLFKKHDRLSSYALIELIRNPAPEAFVDRLVTETKAQDQIAAMIPIRFMGVI